MSEARGGERTEAPSPKRLSDAAKKGDVLQSRELVTALSLAGGIGALLLVGGWLLDSSAGTLRAGLRFDAGDVAGFDPLDRLMALLPPLLLPLGLLFAAVALAAIAAPAMLGSLGWRGSALAFKGERVNPLSGLKRIFGPQGVVELARSFAKLALLGGVLWLWAGDALPRLFALGGLPGVPLAELADLVTSLMLWVLGGFVLIALIDVPIQYVRRMGRLKMTRQELRDEHKESEGAPEKKAAIRQRQMALLSRSMRTGIASANVVVTNPQHFAVALRYRPGVDTAPVIVARGVDALAAAIRTYAGERGVPILSAPPLARAIYFTGKVGDMIDERLFQAVATLLAFLFRLDRAVAAGTPLPELIIPDDCQFDADGHPSR